MKKRTALAAICLLSACQTVNLPVLNKANAGAAATSNNAPMRPSGGAFEAARANSVKDFESCVGIGIIVPGTSPIQCVHDGVTYTGSES
ncbi:hypothetical protein [Planktotalea sp.]|uniref:hypothetical protein n=1 Tax=Planktotalea sp. TaxID=2029877 RepID=UPI003D6A0C4A